MDNLTRMRAGVLLQKFRTANGNGQRVLTLRDEEMLTLEKVLGETLPSFDEKATESIAMQHARVWEGGRK